MSDVVTDYIQNLKQTWQVEICQKIDQIVREALPEVTVRLQYGKPHYLKDGKYAYVLSSAKEWITFTIFNAAALEAPEGFFEAGDPERKTIKIRSGQPVDYDRLAHFVQQTAHTPGA